MKETDFFNEKDVEKPAALTCLFCGQRASYNIRWRQRLKKEGLPSSASREDLQRFKKAQSYLIRVDDKVSCKNIRCRKRFEISGLQTVAFLS